MGAIAQLDFTTSWEQSHFTKSWEQSHSWILQVMGVITHVMDFTSHGSNHTAGFYHVIGAITAGFYQVMGAITQLDFTRS